MNQRKPFFTSLGSPARRQPEQEHKRPRAIKSAIRPALTVGVFSIATLMSGCAGMNAYSPEEVASIAKDDRTRAASDVEPIIGELSLEESIARALKYNLDRRVRLLEETLALGQYEAGNFDMLPRLAAQAGYRSRSNNYISRSTDSVTGLPSLANPSITSDKASDNRDLSLTWNLLDFGTSYFGSQQNADRTLQAAERRRKALHLLIQDVRTAFWRTASAQKLEVRVRDSIALAEEALVDARKAEQERVRPPLDSLRYQRQVLENLRLLENTQQELASARIELAQLINAPIASGLRVKEPAGELGRRILDLPVDQLELTAAARNAELREQFYGARIAMTETRKVMSRLFPNLSYNYSIKYDSNSYLVNRDWNEAGLSLSLNLLNLVSAPAQMRLAEAGVALAEQRRMATQLAVLAQVHLARLQYSNALVQYGRAESIAAVDTRIGEITSSREQAAMQSKLEAVANSTTAILSLLRRYQALAQAHAAASKLQATLGMEPEFESVQAKSLKEIGEVVRNSLRDWDSGTIPPLPVSQKSGAELPATAGAVPAKAAIATPASELDKQTKAKPPATPAALRGDAKPATEMRIGGGAGDAAQAGSSEIVSAPASSTKKTDVYTVFNDGVGIKEPLALPDPNAAAPVVRFTDNVILQVR